MVYDCDDAHLQAYWEAPPSSATRKHRWAEGRPAGNLDGVCDNGMMALMSKHINRNDMYDDSHGQGE
jgi:hypothetical protein